MTPTPDNLNPSQTVERIREIIVGRHLERLEQRVARLESRPSTASGPPEIPNQWEDRFSTYEARIEALQESVRNLAETSRHTALARDARQQEEIKRLSAQIQKVAAERAAETNPDAGRHIEQRIGTWLNQWQAALRKHLAEREEKLTDKLHQDVALLWENTESQITRLESRMLDQNAIEERFRRIADAARALAESASPAPRNTETVQP